LPKAHQFLDLSSTPTFEAAFASQAPIEFTGQGNISAGIAIDPVRHLLLSPDENSNYEIVNIAAPTSPEFFEQNRTTNPSFPSGQFDSAAEDCTTGVALSSDEGTGNIFLADLNQAIFTSGSPAGTWTAPEHLENFPEFQSEPTNLSTGTSAIAVAGASHIAIVNGEFGGNAFGVIRLPNTPGIGGTIPAVSDYIACNVPGIPGGAEWKSGEVPHTITAFVSPNSGDAIALLANLPPPTFLVVIDMTKMLNPTIVPRITSGLSSAHTCDPTTDLVAAGVVKFVAVP
jgi:hypothetical protein